MDRGETADHEVQAGVVTPPGRAGIRHQPISSTAAANWQFVLVLRHGGALKLKRYAKHYFRRRKMFPRNRFNPAICAGVLVGSIVALAAAPSPVKAQDEKFAFLAPAHTEDLKLFWLNKTTGQLGGVQLQGRRTKGCDRNDAVFSGRRGGRPAWSGPVRSQSVESQDRLQRVPRQRRYRRHQHLLDQEQQGRLYGAEPLGPIDIQGCGAGVSRFAADKARAALFAATNSSINQLLTFTP